MTVPSAPSQPALRGQPPDAQWVVQKFGGTSIGKFLDNITGDIVQTYLSKPYRVALVCSALSGSTKSTGTTNLLLRSAAEALGRPVASAPAPPANGAHGSTSPIQTPGGPPSQSNRPPTKPHRLNTLSRSSSQSGQMSPLRRGFTPAVAPAVNGTSGANGKTNGLTAAGTAEAQMSSSTGSLYGEEEGQSFHATVDELLENHLKAARKALLGDENALLEESEKSELLRDLEEDITADCQWLRRLLAASQIIDELSARSKDVIVGIGERLSCRIIAASLVHKGIDAELVLLDDIVEKAHGEGDDDDDDDERPGATGQLGQPFYDRLAKRLGQRLQECGDRVPVITGFFGVVPGSLLSQIGRGYTDLCAALCAVGLRAAELQVWKEVDGIFTADPRKVPTARLLPVITPDEAAELTFYGSEVIHPFTMEQVIKNKIPIRIVNVQNVKGEGTIIWPVPDLAVGQGQAGAAGTRNPSLGSNEELQQVVSGGSTGASTPAVDVTSPVNGYPFPPALARPDSPRARHRLPTAVTYKDEMMVLNVHSNRKTLSHGFLARIFGTLDRYGVAVDLIATSEVHVSMAMCERGVRRSIRERLLADLRAVGEVEVLRGMVILSLVGRQMKNMVGIAGKMFTVLAEGNINIEMISQGASEINISCVINGKDAVKALNLVHHNLLSVALAPVLSRP